MRTVFLGLLGMRAVWAPLILGFLTEDFLERPPPPACRDRGAGWSSSLAASSSLMSSSDSRPSSSPSSPSPPPRLRLADAACAAASGSHFSGAFTTRPDRRGASPSWLEAGVSWSMISRASVNVGSATSAGASMRCWCKVRSRVARLMFAATGASLASLESLSCQGSACRLGGSHLWGQCLCAPVGETTVEWVQVCTMPTLPFSMYFVFNTHDSAAQDTRRL